MRKITVFQHVGHEPLGTLNPMLKAAGFRIRYVNYGRHPDAEPSLEGYNGLIILGGPMGVYEAHRHTHLKHEMKLIETALKMDVPVLGICLGAQMIASVLGAHVGKAPQWEIGWYNLEMLPGAKDDPLFGFYGENERVFQLHQDRFEPPRSAVNLARTELCEAQAFSYGKKVYGLQFHLEVDQAMIHRWLQRPEHRELMQHSKGRFVASQIEAETGTYISRSLELSRATFAKFIEIFQLPERPKLLGSSHGGKV